MHIKMNNLKLLCPSWWIEWNDRSRLLHWDCRLWSQPVLWLTCVFQRWQHLYVDEKKRIKWFMSPMLLFNNTNFSNKYSCFHPTYHAYVFKPVVSRLCVYVWARACVSSLTVDLRAVGTNHTTFPTEWHTILKYALPDNLVYHFLTHPN